MEVFFLIFQKFFRLPACEAGGGGEQVEIFLPGVAGGGLLQGAAARHHVGEIHHRAVCHRHSDVQVSQPHIAVQAEGGVSHLRQSHANIGHE